jgi:tetrahydromethanopterin S-methyltransferase subunit G
MVQGLYVMRLGVLLGAEAHVRELPDHINEAANGIDDADRRVLAMLGARWQNGGKSTGRGGGLSNEVVCLVGSEGGFRTPDPAVNSRLLYH